MKYVRFRSSTLISRKVIRRKLIVIVEYGNIHNIWSRTMDKVATGMLFFFEITTEIEIDEIDSALIIRDSGINSSFNNSGIDHRSRTRRFQVTQETAQKYADEFGRRKEGAAPTAATLSKCPDEIEGIHELSR